MKRSLKIAGISLLGAILICAIAFYVFLKHHGLIPRYEYDVVAPDKPVLTRPAILVLSKTNGFIHHDALPEAEAMLTRIAKHNDWSMYHTKNGATHTPTFLEDFDVIVWNNVSGDVLDAFQRTAMRKWIEEGGTWIGIHASGGELEYRWDWYVDELLGAQFVGHTMDPQFQDAEITVNPTGSSITAHLSSVWKIPNEEWYAFDQSPNHATTTILLTLDESSYITVGENFFGQDRMQGEHPITWSHRQGKGKVFYTAIGHQAATYQIPEFVTLIENAIAWGLN
ncbi:ThuA domain-containing protein [Congregibacter brevis]|uniref:ThuA domain-containing protein n=1 Tax=Congregibacter brevis TaxID=3081201 RepID=A0ABZ0IF52_9GAMM|nr:ThuA domain-containing protein [Congregibacter sp. IMCC45268]